MPLSAEKKALYAYNKRMKRYAENAKANISFQSLKFCDTWTRFLTENHS